MKEIAAALIEAQKELPLVMAKKSKGHHSAYTSLEDLIERVRPVLQKHGIALVQTGIFQDGQAQCRTRLIHTSGELIDGFWPIMESGDNKLHPAQAMGQGWTYARRYSLAAILGIGTGDQDVDASEPPAEQPPREMTDEERERFIAKVQSLAGDVEKACKIMSVAEARKMVEWLESRKQA